MWLSWATVVESKLVTSQHNTNLLVYLMEIDTEGWGVRQAAFLIVVASHLVQLETVMRWLQDYSTAQLEGITLWGTNYSAWRTLKPFISSGNNLVMCGHLSLHRKKRKENLEWFWFAVCDNILECICRMHIEVIFSTLQKIKKTKLWWLMLSKVWRIEVFYRMAYFPKNGDLIMYFHLERITGWQRC